MIVRDLELMDRIDDLLAVFGAAPAAASVVLVATFNPHHRL